MTVPSDESRNRGRSHTVMPSKTVMPGTVMPGTVIEVFQGDITILDVDAIANAANSALAGGGGVDGAIHRAAGLELKRYTDVHYDGCPTGECRISPGFRLKARHVLHCVGPVWRGGESGEDALLAGCYRNALRLADEHGLSSVAFPAISTGIYGYPADRAVGIAVTEVTNCLHESTSVNRVVFACFGDEMAGLYRDRLGID